MTTNKKYDKISNMTSNASPGLSKKVIIVDFPDQKVGNIYGPRWYNTAKILCLKFSYESSEFGCGKYHYKMTVQGDDKNIEKFVQFVEESLELADLSLQSVL